MANHWSTHVTVATVIEQDGQYLFVEEHSKGVVHTVYNQPAGHLEYNETLIEAAQRETLEETGYTVEIDHLIGIYTYTPPMAPDRSYFRFCFAAHITHPIANTTLDPDIIRTTWLTKEQLEHTAQARSPLVLQAIQDYEQGQKYPLSMIYEHPFHSQPTLTLDT
ncbi:NUDIX hydrolase [Acinetobacter sp. B10A]|uniref:NUDIX hydrolase n=1 Tax=Acinetobacter baretiae TaxID=2605383 RepID=UPI001B3C9167|nr:NUDIX hydrolase [Acinetobacter baretiae]MBF7684661.1 NUDIX hydrolase [Acinetobacter baretiae]